MDTTVFQVSTIIRFCITPKKQDRFRQKLVLVKILIFP